MRVRLTGEEWSPAPQRGTEFEVVQSFSGGGWAIRDSLGATWFVDQEPGSPWTGELIEEETDEHKALGVARNIVNQIGDLWSEKIPSDDWVAVRQETNDELDSFVKDLIVEFAQAKTGGMRGAGR